jgi:tetratricopeptide (TPR) repeat protein
MNLGNLGDIARDQGDFTRARALHEEGLALKQEMDDTVGIAASLESLGELAHVQGDFARAEALFAESLALARSLSDTADEASALLGLGLVAHDGGDLTSAHTLLAESLTLYRDMGSSQGTVESVENLARVAAARGDPLRATRLLGAIEVARATLGFPRPPRRRTAHDRTVAVLRAGLGEAVFETAWEAGARLSLARAIAEALGTATTG